MNEAAFAAFIVEPQEAGQRLDVLLAARLGVSRARAQKLLESVTVNGVAAKSSHLLKNGDAVAVAGDGGRTPAPMLVAGVLVAPLPPILFEDEHLIVLNKPRGLAVHAGAGEPQATLVDVLRAHGRQLSGVGPDERAGIVHRLDKDTSGVMLVCKTDAAHWKLASDFAERRVTKLYKAVVCGVPPARGRIEAPIARHRVNRKKMSIAPEGRPSVTEYSVDRAWLKFALLQIKLLTGRTHQIRVHLAYVQHPIVGDAVYGGLHRALQSAPHEAVREAIEALSGQALHAFHLAFTHPISGEALEFEVPLPDKMRRVIEALD
ncbi:MAG TPA: RluA family pseudouridine synthase [Abditibacteriaceae bacterium]|nr:RluA family pseudouridine synthase [Abditibacteriaceae bacterium]